MNRIKSHIVFSKQQRYGVFILLICVAILQFVYFYMFNETNLESVLSVKQKNQLEKIDSLKQVALTKKEVKIYPFNPNYITDFKGYQLGMSLAEIDRLFAFRKQNKWINSAKGFQEVTKMSDSLLDVISPYFKFPNWVNTLNSTTKKNNYSIQKNKIDLNSANNVDLQLIYGIGPSFSKKIINYRNKLIGGFASFEELYAIYGLTEQTINQIKIKCIISNPRQIIKLNINNATRDQLVTIPFVDYEIAFNILEYRSLHEKIKDLNELLRINNFPTSKINIIKLYLRLK